MREAWRLDRLERRDARDGDEVILDEVESPTASTAADRIAVDRVTDAMTIHPRRRRMLLLQAAGCTYGAGRLLSR